MKAKHIVVLKGGKSTEKEVSLRSGAAVAEALRTAGFLVTEIDPAVDGLSAIEKAGADCAFIALHGIGGEDGAIQGYLEWLGLSYTGPGIAASAICLDKILTKKVLKLSSVPTPNFLEIGLGSDMEEETERILEELSLPVVLKACRQGSSIGTVIAKSREEILSGLREISDLGDDILAEKFLSGMELTVPILGNGDPEVLPIIEIVSEGQFYDYTSKYTPGQSHHILPARIPNPVKMAVEEAAKKAYLATGCRGFARVDLMLDAAGIPYVIEINTSPGMTSTSLFPDAAAFAGISFPELVTRLVELAME